MDDRCGSLPSIQVQPKAEPSTSHSGWLQAGLHITILTLSSLPAGCECRTLHSRATAKMTVVTIFLLIFSAQLPTCSSPWRYVPPSTTQFPAYVHWTACQALPRVLTLAIFDVVTIVAQWCLTILALELDYRHRRQSQLEQQVSRIIDEQHRVEKRGSMHPQRHKMDEDVMGTALRMTRHVLKRKRRLPETVARRWQIGVGQLLWDTEIRLAVSRGRA